MKKIQGPVKCTQCNQSYKPELITEDGICDYCDRDNLDDKEINLPDLTTHKKTKDESKYKHFKGKARKQRNRFFS